MPVEHILYLDTKLSVDETYTNLLSLEALNDVKVIQHTDRKIVECKYFSVQVYKSRNNPRSQHISLNLFGFVPTVGVCFRLVSEYALSSQSQSLTMNILAEWLRTFKGALSYVENYYFQRILQQGNTLFLDKGLYDQKPFLGLNRKIVVTELERL